MNRLHNLDYLRGLAAFGIMFFHYLSLSIGDFSADSFWGRVGIYGVSIFYVLSGLTLYYVYHSKMLPSIADVKGFLRKRFFRIFPLLWLATLASLLLSRVFPDISKLILNLTGLFGFFEWDANLAIGAWSIGNELVFYVFFPFFILFLKRSKTALVFFSIIIAGIYFYFAFEILSTEKSLEEQWENYVNPLNQIFLFLGGFLIGVIFQNRRITTPVNLLILLIGIGLFVLFPVAGTDRIYLVTGIGRLIFTLSCFLICIGFYKSGFPVPKIVDKPLSLLGEASYSVYLLHPLVFSIVGAAFGLLSKIGLFFLGAIKISISVIITVLASYFVYQYFEKYFMRLGRQKKQTTVVHIVPE